MTTQRAILRAARRRNSEAAISLAKRRAWHTTGVDQFTSAGLARVEWCRIDAVGIMTGVAGTLTAGADDGLNLLAAPQSFGLTVQQPRRVNIPGANGVEAVFFFESDALPSGDMVLGAIDLNLIARATNSLVATDGDWDVPLLQPEGVTFNRLCIITTADAKSSESGSVGNAGFMITIYPNVQVVPLGAAGLSNAAGTTFTHALIASKFDVLPWGVALTANTNGALRGVGYGPFFSENKVSFHVLEGHGTPPTTVSLDHTPIAYNTNKIKAWDIVDSTGVGTPITYGAGAGNFTAATNVVTLGTGTALNHRTFVRYEW